MHGFWRVVIALGVGAIIVDRPKTSITEQRLREGLCLKCGYDLTGNESGVCPECGTAIDPPAGEPES